jgi:hypothetical protein
VRRAVRQTAPARSQVPTHWKRFEPIELLRAPGSPGGGTVTIEGTKKYETGGPGGVALIAVGTTALVVGTFVFLVGFASGCGCGAGGNCTTSSGSQADNLAIGVGATALSGLGALISGIVLVAIYRRRPSVSLTLQDAGLGGRIEKDASLRMPIWGESRAVFAPRVATPPVLRLQF